MNFSAAASLINFLGFTLGTALYAVLLMMVTRHPIQFSPKKENSHLKFTVDWLLPATAILGLLWNIGNLVELARRDYWGGHSSPFLMATAYTALGFLPAAVVHSEWLAEKNEKDSKAKLLTVAAYILSAGAGLLHFRAATVTNTAASISGLQILTVGYLIILAASILIKRQQSFGRKSVWMAAIAVFAVSALHLSQPHTEGNGNLIELVGHQASLPLVFVILYQDFRFAFADIFLKRALSLVLLTAFVSGVYIFLIVPLLAMHEKHPQPDTQQIAVMIAFGIASAFAYPKLNQLAIWFVDTILLHRVPYERLQTEIMNRISTLEPIEAVLDEVKEKLFAALTAKTAVFREIYQKSDFFAANEPLVNLSASEAEVLIPTADEPHYQLILRDFAGGRRLLSNEIEMLETVALHTARRIDALRVTHERCERELREQELSQLATEAELRVLRAQINPHFLFNALTTIGYLIQTAPERAVQTLLQLTEMLRGSLRSSGEFQSLGDELKLIRSYLEIEKARFEERLTVEINVAAEFLSFRIPSLILQPLVENAVKHGISPKKKGGTVKIEARRDDQYFILQVIDTGAGISREELDLKRKSRVGLNNVEQRLHLHFNGAANLTISEGTAGETIAKIQFDLNAHRPFQPHQAANAVLAITENQAERAYL